MSPEEIFKRFYPESPNSPLVNLKYFFDHVRVVPEEVFAANCGDLLTSEALQDWLRHCDASRQIHKEFKGRHLPMFLHYGSVVVLNNHYIRDFPLITQVSLEKMTEPSHWIWTSSLRAKNVRDFLRVAAPLTPVLRYDRLINNEPPKDEPYWFHVLKKNLWGTNLKQTTFRGAQATLDGTTSTPRKMLFPPKAKPACDCGFLCVRPDHYTWPRDSAKDPTHPDWLEATLKTKVNPNSLSAVKWASLHPLAVEAILAMKYVRGLERVVIYPVGVRRPWREIDVSDVHWEDLPPEWREKAIWVQELSRLEARVIDRVRKECAITLARISSLWAPDEPPPAVKEVPMIKGMPEGGVNVVRDSSIDDQDGICLILHNLCMLLQGRPFLWLDHNQGTLLSGYLRDDQRHDGKKRVLGVPDALLGGPRLCIPRFQQESTAMGHDLIRPLVLSMRAAMADICPELLHPPHSTRGLQKIFFPTMDRLLPMTREEGKMVLTLHHNHHNHQE